MYVRASCGSRAPCGLRARCGSRTQQSCSTPARCSPCALCSGWLWARSDSVCQSRVCSCVPGHCTRSVGNAPLLIGCSAPDRVHRPVTGAAPPARALLLVVVWLFVRVVGAFVPGCPRDFAASLRSECPTRFSPEPYGRCLRPVCPCGGCSKTLSAIPGANQSIGSAHWRVSAAIRWAQLRGRSVRSAFGRGCEQGRWGAI